MEPLLQDEKGVADAAENHHSSPTGSPARPTLPPHPRGCAWKTLGELHRNREFLFSLSVRRLCFFNTGGTEVSLTDRKNAFLCFLQQPWKHDGSNKLLIRAFPPKTLTWPHHCGSTQPGSLHKVIIQQNNTESHGKNLLCC